MKSTDPLQKRRMMPKPMPENFVFTLCIVSILGLWTGCQSIPEKDTTPPEPPQNLRIIEVEPFDPCEPPLGGDEQPDDIRYNGHSYNSLPTACL